MKEKRECLRLEETRLQKVVRRRRCGPAAFKIFFVDPERTTSTAVSCRCFHGRHPEDGGDARCPVTFWAGSLLKYIDLLLLAAHLLLGDGHRALEDDPLDALAAGRRRQGAVVDEVLVRGVWQEASQGEGGHLGALTWGAHRAVGVSTAERGATTEEKEMEKNKRKDKIDMKKKKKDTGSGKRRTVSAHAVDAVNDGDVVLVLLIARLWRENQRKRPCANQS